MGGEFGSGQNPSSSATGNAISEVVFHIELARMFQKVFRNWCQHDCVLKFLEYVSGAYLFQRCWHIQLSIER